MTQPKIDTTTGFLKIDCLNFDIMSGYDSEDTSPKAPMIHDRGTMLNFFQMPPSEEISFNQPKVTGKLEFKQPSLKRYSSATSMSQGPLEDQG